MRLVSWIVLNTSLLPMIRRYINFAKTVNVVIRHYLFASYYAVQRNHIIVQWFLCEPIRNSKCHQIFPVEETHNPCCYSFLREKTTSTLTIHLFIINFLVSPRIRNYSSLMLFFAHVEFSS